MRALKGLLTASLLACTATIAAAQVVPVSEAGPYTIARFEGEDTCFAAVELTSEADQQMVYTYYATTRGQRWTVTGYAVETTLKEGLVNIAVAVDGQETVARETLTRASDFMLPFEALAEITAHEALVETGEVLSVDINGEDTLLVPLSDYRIALEAMANCLASFEN